jgi:hypothetical protein
MELDGPGVCDMEKKGKQVSLTKRFNLSDLENQKIILKLIKNENIQSKINNKYVYFINHLEISIIECGMDCSECTLDNENTCT